MKHEVRLYVRLFVLACFAHTEKSLEQNMLNERYNMQSNNDDDDDDNNNNAKTGQRNGPIDNDETKPPGK
jgi:hypothetical protein